MCALVFCFLTTDNGSLSFITVLGLEAANSTPFPTQMLAGHEPTSQQVNRERLVSLPAEPWETQLPTLPQGTRSSRRPPAQSPPLRLRVQRNRTERPCLWQTCSTSPPPAN